MRGWEMRWRILIMQSEGDEGGICVVAESCHQTSEGIGLMASIGFLYNSVSYKVVSIKLIHINHQPSQAPLNPGKPARNGVHLKET